MFQQPTEPAHRLPPMETDRAEILIQRNRVLLELAQEMRIISRESVETAREVFKKAATMQERAVIIAERARVIWATEHRWVDAGTGRTVSNSEQS